MTPSKDLRRAILNALATGRPRPTRTTGRSAPSDPDRRDPPRDPDWAVREIVDEVLFERAQ